MWPLLRVHFTRLLFQWVLICPFYFVQAQDIAFRVTGYDESEGLASKYVRCMIQDRKGMLWFGTIEGLSSFDGYRFKMFSRKSGDSNSLSSNYVTALAEGQDGLIWIGYQQGGVTSYDPASGRFRNYALVDKNNKRFPTHEIRMVHVDMDNDVWISIYREGFMRLDKKTGQCVKYSLLPADTPLDSRRRLYDYATGISEVKKGRFWVATADGLYHFDKKTAKLRSVPFPIPPQNFIRSDLFTSIHYDRDTIWLGSWSGGISYYHPRSGKWGNFKHEPGIISGTTNIINGMVAKGRDTLWIAAATQGGFGYFLKSKGTFHFYNNMPGLPAGNCFGLWKDRSGNFWLNHEKGLYKVQIDKKKFSFHKTPVTRSDNGELYIISKIFENERFLIEGTMFADGIHVYDKQKGTKKTLAFDFDLDEKVMIVNDIIEDSKGVIWIATRDYIYQLDQDKTALRKPAQPPLFSAIENTSNFFHRLCEDKEGNIWITSRRNGVFVYERKSGTYRHYATFEKGESHIPESNIKAISMDYKGNVWIGGINGYLAYFGALTHRFTRISAKTLGEAAGNHIHALITDRDGTIWAGTNAGLLSFEIENNVPVRTCMLTAENGLRGDIVYDLCDDGYGKIWCVTSSLLCVVKPENHTITSFGASDGIQYSDTEQRIMRSGDHTMRFSLARGYYEFDPAFLKLKRPPVPVLLTSLKVNDQEKYYENQLRRDGKINLRPDENRLSFEFAALDLNQPEKQHYAYMLEGLDETWVNCGGRRYASYTNLPGGDYIFKIRASSVDEDWKDAAVILPVHIETVFYKKFWFRISIFLLACCLIYLFIKYRVRQEQKMYALESRANSLEKEKAMVMYDSLKQQLNPHFLFNSLTSLSSLIRVDQLKAGEFLESLSNTYRYILKNRDSELVSLASELQFTQIYIRLQKTRFDNGLEVNIDVDQEHTHWKIAPVTLQNLIENAIKHNKISGTSPLVIDIYTENDKLVVRNNLQRKNFVETSNRKGLTNLSSLYQYLTDQTIEIIENEKFFIVKIPLI